MSTESVDRILLLLAEPARVVYPTDPLEIESWRINLISVKLQVLADARAAAEARYRADQQGKELPF